MLSNQTRLGTLSSIRRHISFRFQIVWSAVLFFLHVDGGLHAGAECFCMLHGMPAIVFLYPVFGGWMLFRTVLERSTTSFIRHDYGCGVLRKAILATWAKFFRSVTCVIEFVDKPEDVYFRRRQLREDRWVSQNLRRNRLLHQPFLDGVHSSDSLCQGAVL